MKRKTGKGNLSRALFEMQPMDFYFLPGTLFPGRSEVDEVFEYWKKVFNKPRAKMDDKREKLIRAALNLEYTVDDLKQVIDGVRNTPHNMGFNDRQTMYIDIGLIFRDADHIDRYMSKAPAKKETKPKEEEKVSRTPAVKEKALQELRAMKRRA